MNLVFLKKCSLILIVALLQALDVKCQTVITQKDSVIYLGRDSKVLDTIAYKYRTLHLKEYILLDIDGGTSEYIVSYDNIYGTSVNNDIYKPQTWDQKLLGIYIKIRSTTIDAGQVMKMVKYGIENIQRLKKKRKKMMRRHFYNREDNIPLDSKTVKKILSSA